MQTGSGSCSPLSCFLTLRENSHGGVDEAAIVLSSARCVRDDDGDSEREMLGEGRRERERERRVHCSG